MITQKLAPAGGHTSAPEEPAGAPQSNDEDQPEHDTDCPICHGWPCECDRLVDEYRDYLMERDL